MDTAKYTVSGTLNGLASGQSITIADASGVSVAFRANGNYTFVANVPSSVTYSLRVLTQPNGQICNIRNASGKVVDAGVSNVAVNCSKIGLTLNLLAGNVGGAGLVDGTGALARFGGPTGLAADVAGNLYVADISNNTIRKVTSGGVVSTLAGSAGNPGSADGVGAEARFNFTEIFSSPQRFPPPPFGFSGGLAVDAMGNIFVADTFSHTIRKITSAGIVSTLAGNAGSIGSADGTGTAARFSFPSGLATDAIGNVYVADTRNLAIRKITPAGVVSTLAGRADILSAVAVNSFNQLSGVAVDAAGNVYVANSGNHTILKITPGGALSVFAGSSGTHGSNDGFGTEARFFSPYGLATDASGNVYVADNVNNTIRQITPAGVVSTLVGTAGVSGSVDGIGGIALFTGPSGLAIDAVGNIYVSDRGNSTIRKITPAFSVSTLAGSAAANGSADGTGTAATFNYPLGVSTDAAGYVYVADYNNQSVRKTTSAGVVSTLAGSVNAYGSVDGTGTAASFRSPRGVAADAAGNVYVADSGNQAIRKITPAGMVSTWAGSAGSYGSTDGTGKDSRFNTPYGVATDAAGNVYVVDVGNHTVRRITPAGVVSTLAGSAGNAGSDDGTGAAARFNYPQGIAADAVGNVYIADSGSHTIRKVTPGGVVSTLAGTAGSRGSDDGTGAVARFNSPLGLSADTTGNVYVADTGNNTIRKISPAGVVSTVVGEPTVSDVLLTQLPAGLSAPQAVHVSGEKLYITTRNGIVWTYAP